MPLAALLLAGCVAEPYPAQPVAYAPAYGQAQPVYGQPQYAPQYAQPVYAQEADPSYDGYYAYPPQTPTVVTDGVTYVDDTPVILAGGALVALAFSSAYGGWGYWGPGHHWYPAPGYIGDRLGHRFPGGRGLPPPRRGGWGGGWGGGRPYGGPPPSGWNAGHPGGPPQGGWNGGRPGGAPQGGGFAGRPPGPPQGGWNGGRPGGGPPQGGGFAGRPGPAPQMQFRGPPGGGEHRGPPPRDDHRPPH